MNDFVAGYAVGLIGGVRGWVSFFSLSPSFIFLFALWCRACACLRMCADCGGDDQEPQQQGHDGQPAAQRRRLGGERRQGPQAGPDGGAERADQGVSLTPAFPRAFSSFTSRVSSARRGRRVLAEWF